MATKKRIYKRVKKPFGIHPKTERKFVNKMGLNGWELFADFIPKEKGKSRMYHFRKLKP